MTLTPLASVLAIVTAAIAAGTDLRSGRIPNLLTVPAFLVAVAVAAIDGGAEGAMMAVVGALFTAALPCLAFYVRAMGGGDVKLFAALGAMVGPALGTELLFFATVAASVQAVVLVTVRGQLIRMLRNVVLVIARPFRRGAIPAEALTLTELRMGPAIFVGTVLLVGIA